MRLMQKYEWISTSKKIADIDDYLDQRILRRTNNHIYSNAQTVPHLVNDISINDPSNSVGIHLCMTDFQPRGLQFLIQYTTPKGGVVFGRLFLLAKSTRWDILTEMLYPTNVRIRDRRENNAVFKDWVSGEIECPENMEDFLSQLVL